MLITNSFFYYFVFNLKKESNLKFLSYNRVINCWQSCHSGRKHTCSNLIGWIPILNISNSESNWYIHMHFVNFLTFHSSWQNISQGRFLSLSNCIVPCLNYFYFYNFCSIFKCVNFSALFNSVQLICDFCSMCHCNTEVMHLN